MKMAKKRELRQEQLLATIEETEFTTIKELVERFGLSEMTIRRDLLEMSGKNLVTAVNGVVMMNKSDKEHYSTKVAIDEHSHQKELIGAMAASCIQPGDIIAIDSGTTTEQLVKYLPEKIDITVLCYNANIFYELHKKNIKSIILCGGKYHAGTEMFQSDEGVALIKKYRTTKSFISAAGVSEKLGITCSNQYEVSTKQAVMSSSHKKILLFHSAKFYKVKSSYFSNLTDFDIIITDQDIPPEAEEIILKNGIELIKA